MTKRYVCIHGHFYQPPRENPWLEAIEVQASAHPYHDWNERIFWECYAPNGAARILDEDDKIAKIVNNYQRISFNFGPTLLCWLDAHHPQLLEKIVDADRASVKEFAGHGNALAQVYHHQIMPLASRRERQAQIAWGIAEFKQRFSRAPEGMWLAETAADLATLKDLAEQNIRFTILSPHQARRIRPIGNGEWQEVGGANVDPSRPYRVFLDKERQSHIDVLFYDAPISQAVSFSGLLHDGEDFFQRIANAFRAEREHAQLVLVATDGETYGHHTRFGDMALAYLLQRVEQEKDLQLTNPAHYLSLHPPTFEVDIFSPSSWSCAHGVDRWRDNCGCNSGQHPRWQQKWRKVLRATFDWLKREFDARYEEKLGPLLRDPWDARQRYCSLLFERSPERRKEFLQDQQSRPLEREEMIQALRGLEMQRNSMLMFTSCGWFFDEISGIEGVQVLSYAARALQLCREFCGVDLERDFCARLRTAESNLPRYQNGEAVFQQLVLPSAVTMQKVIAHHAISSLFDGKQEHPDSDILYCYQLETMDRSYTEKGPLGLLLGQVRATSLLTLASEVIAYAVLKIGEQDFHCALKGTLEEAEYNAAKKELLNAFDSGSTTETIRAIDRQFSTRYFTLNDLFLDERKRVFSLLMKDRLQQMETRFREGYEEMIDFMRSLKQQSLRLPPSFLAISEWLLSEDLQQNLHKMFAQNDAKPLLESCRQIEELGIHFSDPMLPVQIVKELEGELTRLVEDPVPSRIHHFCQALAILAGNHLSFNYWKLQNQFQQLVANLPPARQQALLQTETGESHSTPLSELAEKLGFRAGTDLLTR